MLELVQKHQGWNAEAKRLKNKETVAEASFFGLSIKKVCTSFSVGIICIILEAKFWDEPYVLAAAQKYYLTVMNIFSISDMSLLSLEPLSSWKC